MTTRRGYLVSMGVLCSAAGVTAIGSDALGSREVTRIGEVDVRDDQSAYLHVVEDDSPKIIKGDGADTVSDLASATNQLGYTADVVFVDKSPSGDDVKLHDGSGEVGESHTVSSVSSGSSASIDVSIPFASSLVDSALDYETRLESNSTTVALQRRVTIEKDLLAYYPLEEIQITGSGGTVTDETGNGYDGTTKDGVSTDISGKIGSAFSFDESASRVEVPDTAALRLSGDMTITFWMKTTGLGSSPNVNNQTHMVDKSDFNNKVGYTITDDGDYSTRIFFRVLGSGTYWSAFADRSLVNDGVWHMIAGVRTGDTIKIYVDGTEQGSTSGTVIDNNTLNLGIGANRNGELPLDGALDDLRFYGRALSSAEISALYQSS